MNRNRRQNLIDKIKDLYDHRQNDFNEMFRHCLAISASILNMKLDIVRPHDPFLITIPFDPTVPLVNTTQIMLNIQALLSNREQRRMNMQEIVLEDTEEDINIIHDYFQQYCITNNMLLENNLSLCMKNLTSRKITIFFKKGLRHETINRIRPRKAFINFINMTFWNFRNNNTISLEALINYIRTLFSNLYEQGNIPDFILFLPFILTRIILISLRYIIVNHPNL